MPELEQPGCLRFSLAPVLPPENCGKGLLVERDGEDHAGEKTFLK
jgi:hypothetical protein